MPGTMTATWTHRPTWPKDPVTHATDRAVLRAGVRVGGVMRIEHGPQAGRWQWSGLAAVRASLGGRYSD